VKAPTLATGFAAAAIAVTAAQQPPVFRSGVDLLAVDVTVVDTAGEPVRGLDAQSFTVRVGGQVRRVVDVQWIAPGAATAAAAPALPAGFVSNAAAADGRLIVIVVDQLNIPFASMRPIQEAVGAFIDRLVPSDRIAIIGFDLGNAGTTFTADHERAKRALAALNGRRDIAAQGRHEVGVVAAREFERGYTQAVQAIIARDCFGNTRQRQLCADEVTEEARATAGRAARDLDLTLQRLQDLLTTLAQIEAAKTVLFVSEGFVLPPEDVGTRMARIGELAARSRTTIYPLKIGDDRGSIEQRTTADTTRERTELARGLEALSAAARGSLLNVVGTGRGVFDRITRELSGYYLLGVESDPQLRDGKPHPVRIEVNRRGVTVRARQIVVAEGSPPVRAAPRQQATDALRSPLMLAGLALEGAAFAMRGSDAGHLQLLVHAEAGTGYTAPRAVVTAIDVVDAQGQSVVQELKGATLAPSIPGVPSPLTFTAGLPVAPGEYVVRLAIVDGDRAGSLEIPVRADLELAGPLRITPLIAGGPIPPGSLMTPAIGHRVRFGTVQGYFEAYGPAAGDAAASFEVAVSDAAPALIALEIPPRKAGDDRSIFTAMIQVQSLPPGAYRLRAVLKTGQRTAATLVRVFEIPRIPPTPPSPFFLPVEDASVERLLRAWPAASTDPGARTTPDGAAGSGAALLRARSYADARRLFDESARRWPDDPRFTIGVACLDAMFGRGREALLGLDRYLAAAPDDLEALFLAVAWRFEARRSGIDLEGVADADRARRYAARYRAANGPRQPLVDLWASYLETSTR
jgi:VWFA-related protein